MSSGWTVELSPRAARALRKMDRSDARRVVEALREVERLDDPRTRGKPLTGRLAGLWRYRVGDWRVTCDIEGAALVVLVVEVAHRSEAYGRRLSP